MAKLLDFAMKGDFHESFEISHIAISYYDVTKRNLSDVCQHFKLVYIVLLSDSKYGI